MADIQYEEEQQPQFQSATGQVEQKPFLVRLVLATGVVSSDKEAEYVLLGVVVLVVVISIYLVIPDSSGSVPIPPIGTELKGLPGR